MTNVAFDKKHNIIPIIKNTKRPAVAHVSDWYDKRFPSEDLEGAENFAVVCGTTSNNLVVLDLDYELPMEYTEEIYPSLNVEFGQVVNTYTEYSPNGAHLFYYIKGDLPKTTTNTNSNTQDLRKIIKEYVSGEKRKTLRGLVKVEKTITPDKYHSIDVLSSKKYCLIKPSTIDGRGYEEGLPFKIKTITDEEFEKLTAHFLPKKPIVHRMRKPLMDILEGKIEIESFAKEQGLDEHVYWSGTYKEAWNFLGLVPEEIFPLLEKSQPSFDLEKTLAQLNSGSHNYDDKPLTNETLARYFPHYSYKKPRKTSSSKDPVYIEISEYLTDKYDIITLRDQADTMLIRDGNIYSNKLERFFKDLGEQIKFHGKSMTHTSSNVLKAIKYDTYFDTNTLCYDNWVISFSNGYYDVEEDKFHSNDETTEKAFCYEIPHDYNPKFEGDCIKFKSLLKEWLGEDNVIKPDDIFEMMGYSLMMNTGMKMAFFIYGVSHTGKTQFQTILEYIVGHANRCEVSLQRMCKNEFGSDGMQFKLLDMVGDMSAISMNDVSMFKKITGGDRWIGAEVKGGRQYEFRNIMKMWCNGNDIPILDNDDDAFYGRWILINFPIVHDMFDKNTIKNIGAKLCEDKDEIQAIIHECIKGAKRLRERDYFRKEIIIGTKHLWRYEAEPLYAFLYDNYEYDYEGETLSYDFRRDFNRYLIKRKIRPFTVNKLNAMMENFGIYVRRSMKDGERDNYYVGITTKEAAHLKKKRLGHLFMKTGIDVFS